MGLVSTTISVTPPSSIVAGENPVVFTLSTGTIGSPSPAKAKLKVLSTSTNNVTLTFALPAYTKVFTGKDYPNNDSYFLTGTLKDANAVTVDGSITTSQIASSLADCLKKDIVISKNYYVNYSGSTIIELIAKTASSQYSLSSRVTSSNGSVVSFTSVSSGSDQYEGSQIPDYSLFVEVYKGDDSLELGTTFNNVNFERLTELNIPFSTDNIHRFDVGKIAKSFVKTYRPDFEQSGYTTSQNNNCKYVLPFYLTYGESYPLVAGSNTNKKLQKGITSQVWVTNSSLSLVSANTMSSYTGITNNVKFLTNSPSVKYSNRSQRELLGVIIQKNLGKGLAVRADIKYWDGSSATNELLYKVFTGTTNYGGLYLLNISHEHVLKQFETGSKKIKTVSISLNDSIGKYTVAKKYHYPFTNPVNRVGIAFLNTLGTWDTHDFVGIAEETVDRTKNNLTVPLSINANGSVNKGFKSSTNYNVQVTKKVTVNSGWINHDHFEWLIELMSSNEIYSYTTTQLNYLKLDSYKYTANNQSDQFIVEATFIQTIFEQSVSV